MAWLPPQDEVNRILEILREWREDEIWEEDGKLVANIGVHSGSLVRALADHIGTASTKLISESLRELVRAGLLQPGSNGPYWDRWVAVEGTFGYVE